MTGASPIPYLPVALGSAIGAVARYAVSLAMLSGPGSGLPWGTFAVNVAGSFLIGFLAALMAGGGRFHASDARRQFLLAGFCGGFTTFSIFSLELLFFIVQDAYLSAFVYLGLSIPAWLLAVAIGYGAGERLSRRA